MSYADIIIKSSSIFTAETLDTIEGAVVVKGREIERVCSAEEAERYIGPDTKVLECGDRLVCPGFNDAHTHFIQNGVMKDPSYTLSLEGVTAKNAVLEAIKKFGGFASFCG